MSIWSIGATVLLASIALFSIWVLVVTGPTEREIARAGLTVVGTVIARVSGGEGDYLRLEYTIDGVRYEMMSNQPQVEDVGTTIDIRYLPGKPLDPRLQLGRVEPWHGTIGSIVGIVIGIGGAITTAILGVKGVF
jgi:uncharacterized membrane protein